MSDFPGGWTDMVYLETFVKFSWVERLKLIILGRVIVKNYVLCEKEPGKTKPITHIYIGHPLDDKNFGLRKEEKPD